MIILEGIIGTLAARTLEGQKNRTLREKLHDNLILCHRESDIGTHWWYV